MYKTFGAFWQDFVSVLLFYFFCEVVVREKGSMSPFCETQFVLFLFNFQHPNTTIAPCIKIFIVGLSSLVGEYLSSFKRARRCLGKIDEFYHQNGN